MGLKIPIHPVIWKPCWRIIPSRYPPINAFERVADPDDLEAIFEIESITNDRLRYESGHLHLLPKEDWVTGPGSGYIMAAFTHLNPRGSRFSDGTWGVYYAAHELETAISETMYHREKFMQATQEKPTNLEMRVLEADLKGSFHDIRGPKSVPKSVYDPNSYAKSQGLAKELKKENSWGIICRSVRRKIGENVAVFRPPALCKCRAVKHLIYRWDGKKVRHVFEVKEL